MWKFIQRGTHEMELLANRNQSLSSKYSLVTRHSSQTLIINNTQWSHVGLYKCITFINGTEVEAEASLDVLSELHCTL